jgi:hypothetical protein
MAKFTIHNLSSFSFSIPEPISRIIGPGKAVHHTGPAYLMDTLAMKRAIESGAISVSLDVNDDTTPDDVETTTLSRLVGYHEPIVTPSFGQSLPGTQPVMMSIGSTLFLDFSLNNDAAWRSFKIPHCYVDEAAVHLHWTKVGDQNEFGKAVRWRMSYSIFPGDDAELTAGSPVTVLEYEDTYSSTGTTTRVMNRTPDLPIFGVVANYYMGIKVEAITPVGVAMASRPALMSLDITFRQHILK